jgi:DNA-binding MarR family transcriptional regulator
VREHVAETTYSRAAEKHERGRGATDPELGAWRAFLRASSASLLAMDAALAPTGVTHSEYDVLVNVAGGPKEGVRPTDLALRVLLTKSGLTRLLDRLVERGFIQRHACPTDRRGQLIVLTAEGRHAFRRATPNIVRSIAAMLGDGFTEGEIEALRVSCERIAKAAEAMTA